MQANLPRAPLIVDHDASFLDSLRVDAIASKKGAPPFVATDMKQALEILTMHKASIGFLMVGTRLGRGVVLDLVHAALRIVPGLPVILMSEWEATEFSDEEMRKMVVQTVVRKPFKYLELVKRLATGNPPIRLGPIATDKDFDPLEISQAQASKSAEEDVYVRVRGDRYIKILKAGYAIGAERLERYLKRGIKSFYRSKK